MADSNLEISDIMDASEKEESADKKHNEKDSDDTFGTAKTASGTELISAKNSNNESDDQTIDRAIDELSVLSSSFSGVNSKHVEDLQDSLQSIADIARKMMKSEYSVVTRVSTIVVLVL